MNQQKAWDKEYKEVQGVPTSTRTTASSAVKRLLDYINEHEVGLGKKVIDLGCGIGRNAFYLAENGYDVTAVDFAEEALEKFRKSLNNHPHAQHIYLQRVNLAEKLPFEDNSFDLAIDIVTTMTLEPQEMVGFEAELQRIVKPNGLFLCYVLSNDDGFLEVSNPGQTHTTIEASGITDNYFSEEQLKQLYKKWKVLALDKVKNTDHFYGKTYVRRIWWMLMRNKKL